MEQYLIAGTCMLVTAYGAYTYFIRKGLASLDTAASDSRSTFSVIVAARNEEKNIHACLVSILQQTIPRERYEVILVNDRSTDATEMVAEGLRQQYPQLKIISIREDDTAGRGKKNALVQGIAASNNEILVFTDADCIVPSNWLNEISKSYTDDVGMVVGMYSNDLKELSNEAAKLFFSYEEVKKYTFCAASIGLRQAFLGFGGNISYRREVYQQVNGFDRSRGVVGGDDDLFVQSVQRSTKWSIRFLHPTVCHTTTTPPTTMKEFIRQRIRYISTGKKYSNTKVNLFYITYYLLLVFVVLSSFSLPLFAMTVYGIKIVMDYLQMSPQAAVLGFPVKRLVVGTGIYDLYYLVMSPVAFLLPPSWK
jgi:cellulose synthase/poly-beta-1,6-N-acetylglucosamine synthase-like glycosyltransferase